MEIEFAPAKRAKTLQEHGLDFGRAAEVFDGHHFTALDERKDCDEDRHITVGLLDGRMAVVVWTPRGGARRIISTRNANERERARCRKAALIPTMHRNLTMRSSNVPTNNVA